MIDTKYLRQTAWQFFFEGIKNTSKNGHVKILFFRLFFFLSGFCFTNIHESQDCKGRGKGILLTPHYHFHPLHRQLDNGQAVIAESLASSRTRTGNLWFPSASH